MFTGFDRCPFIPLASDSFTSTKKQPTHVDCFLSFIYLQNCIQEIFSFILPITLLGHALDRLVSVSSIHYCTSTSDLSTSSSSRGLTSLRMGYLILRGASRLDAFSVYPFQTWLLCHAVGRQQIHQWSVHPGPLVLRTAPLKYPPPAPDRDRTVSRRSEPSSRTALMGEQPNPWDLLQPQDAMSRHRGAKPLRRCELLGVISLLSPG